MNSLFAFWRLLCEVPLRKISLLFITMVLASLSEGVGILLLVPILELLQGPPFGVYTSAISAQRYLHPLLSTDGNLVNILSILGVFVCLVALRCLIQFTREQLSTNIQYQLIDQLRLRCFNSLMNAEWRWLSLQRHSDYANTLMTNISRIGLGLNFGINLISSSITLLAYLTVAFLLSWSMATVAVFGGVCILFLFSKQRKAALDLGQKLGPTSRALQANVHESLTGIKIAKILGLERHHVTQFSKAMDNLRIQQLEFSTRTSSTRAMLQFGGALFLAIYLFLGFEWWHTPTPTLLTLVFIFSRLIPQFSSIQQFHHQWLQALPAIQDTYQLLSDCQLHAEPQSKIDYESFPVRRQIELDGISVGYAGRNEPSLININLHFPTQTTTAIMGPSGAGKSTLADILMGLLIPDAGKLKVDGVLIEGEMRKRWRNSVAYVPQEIFLFHDTIRKNLLWGNLDANDLDLTIALAKAAAYFVEKLPKGLDTVIGDGGVLLSGGERQRLALARALLKNPTLLILDEATSALDIENETHIRRAIEQLHGNLTMVIIGHRLPTLEHADQVIVLNNGRIQSQGSWSQIKKVR
jgi:ATP-binding cassette subfamily C protein